MLHNHINKKVLQWWVGGLESTGRMHYAGYSLHWAKSFSSGQADWCVNRGHVGGVIGGSVSPYASVAFAKEQRLRWPAPLIWMSA